MIINAAGTLQIEDHALKGKLANGAGLIRRQARGGAGDAIMEEATETGRRRRRRRKEAISWNPFVPPR